METTTKKHLLLAALGATSGGLGILFDAGVVQLPTFSLMLLPSVIFSLVILATISAIYPATRPTIGYMRWLSSFAALAVGMPAALYTGAVILNVVDLLIPGTHYQVGGIAISFFIAELVSSASWSFVVSLCLFFLCRAGILSSLVLCLPAMLSTVVLSNVLEVASTILLHKSPFLGFVSVTLQMVSALVLSIGVARSTKPRTGIGPTNSEGWQTTEQTSRDPQV